MVQTDNFQQFLCAFPLNEKRESPLACATSRCQYKGNSNPKSRREIHFETTLTSQINQLWFAGLSSTLKTCLPSLTTNWGPRCPYSLLAHHTVQRIHNKHQNSRKTWMNVREIFIDLWREALEVLTST